MRSDRYYYLTQLLVYQHQCGMCNRKFDRANDLAKHVKYFHVDQLVDKQIYSDILMPKFENKKSKRPLCLLCGPSKTKNDLEIG